MAAVATALPESTIPMVAIITGEESGQVAIGAIIGAPLLLATIAMLLVALSSRGFKERREQGARLRLHRRTTGRDLIVFLILFGMAIGLGMIGSTVLNLIGAGICVVASELPEKANSFFWVRKGQDTLALGNITGAMVFQSAIPVAVGLAYTPWRLEGPAVLAGGCALAGGGLALIEVLRKGRFSTLAMVLWAVLYGGFVVATVATR